MTTVLVFILVVYLCYFLAKWFFKVAMPRIVMWGLNRHIRKKYGNAYDQAFGQQSEQQSRTGRSTRRQRQNAKRPRRQGKIIPDDVGEYVDFEEIPTYNEPSSSETDSQSATKKYKDEPQITDADWEEIK